MPSNLSRRTLLGSAASTLALLALGSGRATAQGAEGRNTALARQIEPHAEPLPEFDDPGFARFIDRHAEAKVALLGEASHGTDEFYRARTAVTERLVRDHGFTVVAVEADWPDAARMDAHIHNHRALPSPDTPFPRFPPGCGATEPWRT